MNEGRSGHEQVVQKLATLLGAEKARQVVVEVLTEARLESLATPADRLRFSDVLERRRGVFAAVARSIRIAALLEGGRAAG